MKKQLLCLDIQILCQDTTKGRLKDECRDIAKIVATQASQSSLRVCCDKGFHVATTLPEINSARQIMSRFRKPSCDNYEKKLAGLCHDISKVCRDTI